MIFTSDLKNKMFSKKSFRFFTRFKHSKVLDSNHSCLCFCMCVWFSVWMCVCVFVCVCMSLYSFTVKASLPAPISWTYLRGTDQRSCVVTVISGSSTTFLHLRFEECHISPPKTKLQQLKNWREYDLIYCPLGRRYILMKDISQTSSPYWRTGRNLFVR